MKPYIVKTLISAIIAAGLTSGCVFLPNPHYYFTGSRQNLTGKSVNLLKPGKDTVDTVILKFGDPDIKNESIQTDRGGPSLIINARDGRGYRFFKEDALTLELAIVFIQSRMDTENGRADR